MNEEEIRKIIEDTGKDAREYEMKYFGCGQTTLAALQKNLKIGNLESLKAATVFAGGAAARGGTCGALIGALMAFGLVVGREKIEDTATYRSAIRSAEVQEFCDKFEKEFGSTLCSEIQKRIFGMCFNFRDPRGREQFEKAGGHSENGCPRVVEFAAKTMAEIILRSRFKK